MGFFESYRPTKTIFHLSITQVTILEEIIQTLILTPPLIEAKMTRCNGLVGLP
jgi:hypothetical protein